MVGVWVDGRVLFDAVAPPRTGRPAFAGAEPEDREPVPTRRARVWADKLTAQATKTKNEIIAKDLFMAETPYGASNAPGINAI